MKVTQVSAAVRYSKQLDDGSHKTIELSAEAMLTTQENWLTAQSQLYTELGQQLKGLWTTKNGNDSVTEKAEHYCTEHGAPFQQYTKGDQTWYAHKDGAQWCRERSQ